MVAEEEAPLGVVRDRRRPVEDLDHRQRLLPPQRHEHPRHHGEVEGHVALVPVAEVCNHVLRPLVRLGEEHAVGVVGVDLGRTRFRYSCVRGRFSQFVLLLEEVRHRVEAEAVEAEVEPEAQHLDHRVLHRRVLVVEVGLVAEEAVPVVLAADGVVRPVRDLGVDEDDPASLYGSSVSDQT